MREKLVELLMDMPFGNSTEEAEERHARDTADYLIDNDVVPVVRCRDCKHCKKHPTSDRVKMCTNEQQWVTECYPLVHDDDFCSYGERREGE